MNALKPPVREGAVVLGFTPMDDVHAEFSDLVERATYCPDADFPARLDALVAHLEAHFGLEDQWMAETDFPPGDCHRDEHAAVLSSAAEVQALALPLRVQIGRDFVRELAAWFPVHADYLDSALAAWMCRRAHGGKPIVLHRRTNQHGIES
jgi:hemerythrin